MGMIGNHYEIIGNLLKNIIRIWRFHKKMLSLSFRFINYSKSGFPRIVAANNAPVIGI